MSGDGTGRVVTIGETMVALRGAGLMRLGSGFHTSIAGAESNVAIGLARLGHPVTWAGRVGDDEGGELILRVLRAEGVETTVATRGPGPTGLVLFEQRLPGVARVQYYRRESAGSALCPADVVEAVTPGTRLLHVTGITPALGAQPRAAVEAAVARARELAVPVSLDVNHRSRLWSAERASEVLTPLAGAADVVIGSDDELDLVGGAGRLLEAGVAEVVTKLGADGASLRTADGRWTAPGNRVAVVDAVGAGDAFTAGYLSARLDGLAPADRLARGNACGAFAVATAGDWEGLPTRPDLPLVAREDGAVLR
ncbi:sugar kinase [Pseudonocardia nematodicida]|uniref:Sugar kinase n=1 Tax=Pseudonocardia nematodicida TaxID=1206997 RepID=A0ABV1K3I8_9PSEU